MSIKILSYFDESATWDMAWFKSYVDIILCINDLVFLLEFYDKTRFLQTLEDDQFFYLQDNVVILNQINKDEVYNAINNLINRKIYLNLKVSSMDSVQVTELVILDYNFETI